MNQVYHTRLSDGRRIVIPASVCKKLGLAPGDPIAIEVGEDGLHLVPCQQVVRAVQSAFARYRPANADVVEDFIRDRRQEAAQDDEKPRCS